MTLHALGQWLWRLGVAIAGIWAAMLFITKVDDLAGWEAAGAAVIGCIMYMFAIGPIMVLKDHQRECPKCRNVG